MFTTNKQLNWLLSIPNKFCKHCSISFDFIASFYAHVFLIKKWHMISYTIVLYLVYRYNEMYQTPVCYRRLKTRTFTFIHRFALERITFKGYSCFQQNHNPTHVFHSLQTKYFWLFLFKPSLTLL